MSSHSPDDPRRQGLRQRLHKVADLLDMVAQSKSSRTKSAPQGTPVNTKLDQVPAQLATAPSKSDLLHDLRVACRRAETALKACRSQLTHQESSWFKDQMRSLRKSCNPLRDDEVFRKWLEKQSPEDPQQQLLKSVADTIRDERKKVVAQSRTMLRRHHFRRHTDELWPVSDKSNNDRSNRERTSERDRWRYQLGKWLFHLVDQMIQAIPDDHHDYDALHQLRIAVKCVRYGLEYASELDPQLTLRQSIGRLQIMQDKLGDLHDAVVRLRRLESEYSKQTTADQLIPAAREELQQCASNWRRWWKPATLKQLVVQCGTEVSKLVVSEK